MAAENLTTGLPKNTSAALSYVLGPVTGVIFFVLEKDPFVRFHAMQSIIVSVVFIFISIILGPIGIILGLTVIFAWLSALLVGIVNVGGFVLWLLLIYKAWMGQEWEVPILGKYARKFSKIG